MPFPRVGSELLVSEVADRERSLLSGLSCLSPGEQAVSLVARLIRCGIHPWDAVAQLTDAEVRLFDSRISHVMFIDRNLSD